MAQWWPLHGDGTDCSTLWIRGTVAGPNRRHRNFLGSVSACIEGRAEMAAQVRVTLAPGCAREIVHCGGMGRSWRIIQLMPN